MRAMPIQVFTGSSGGRQLKAALRANWRHYLREALGLGIFMVSACFFSAMLFSEKTAWSVVFPGFLLRNVIMGVAMGGTALFIFYARWTAPSGSHINPAVTLTFLRLHRMCRYDALFFMIAQVAGGTLAVCLMRFLMGNILTEAPVRSAVTVPGSYGWQAAFATEFGIGFVTMAMVLFTSASQNLKKYTRLLAAGLVCVWVIVAGPVSGFGMNPARSFASAYPAGIWTSFWMYLLVPMASMLLAAEVFLVVQKKNISGGNKAPSKKNLVLMEPLEFLL